MKFSQGGEEEAKRAVSGGCGLKEKAQFGFMDGLLDLKNRSKNQGRKGKLIFKRRLLEEILNRF